MASGNRLGGRGEAFETLREPALRGDPAHGRADRARVYARCHVPLPSGTGPSTGPSAQRTSMSSLPEVKADEHSGPYGERRERPSSAESEPHDEGCERYAHRRH
jgi:hypothetical protein